MADTPADQVTVTLELGPYGEDFANELRFLVANARAALRAIEDGTFIDQAKPDHEQEVVMMIPAPEFTEDEMKHRVVANTFCSMVRELIGLIELRYVLTHPFELTVGKAPKEPTEEFIKRVVNDEVYKLATDAGKAVPTKLGAIPNLMPVTIETVTGYNKIRNSIEHHGAVAKTEMTLIGILPALLVNGEAVDLPYETKAGDEVGGPGTIEARRTFNAGEQILLTEKDLEAVYFCMNSGVGEDLLS